MADFQRIDTISAINTDPEARVFRRPLGGFYLGGQD